MTDPVSPELQKLIRETFVETGSKKLTAERLGLHRDTVRKYAVEISPPAPLLRIQQTGPVQFKRPGVRTYLITAAQNNTAIHLGFWNNLRAYAEWLDARLMVGGFIYRKEAMGQRGQEKASEDSGEIRATWAPELSGYRADQREMLTPGLVYMGQMNTLPTNVDPLAGLTGFSRGDSAIYPHVKVAMRSLATAPDEPAKLLYTTGAVTVPNYIQRKSGQVAEFHHVLGAVIVEVDEDAGLWFVRQLNAMDDGSFQDLDRKVEAGRVSDGHGVLAINWGDIHQRKLEPAMLTIGWGEDGILNSLRPRYQFFHDLVDAESANPHDRGSHLRQYDLERQGKRDIRAELDEVFEFLADTFAPGVQSVVVPSNHDDMLKRWLESTDPRTDPRNLRLWSEANLASLDMLDAGKPVDLVKWYMERSGLQGVVFVPPNKPTFKLRGIEFGQHGHIGPNGVKGTPKSFTMLATKINTGHTHAATIYDGVYTAGVQARLFHGYNIGYSNWSQSMIVTYDSGKRAIVTMRGNKWRL